MSKNNIKYKFFTFVLYSEHYPDLEYLKKDIESLGLPALISPIHDQDQYTDEDVKKAALDGRVILSGDFKKPHYHILIQSPYSRQVGGFYNQLIENVSFSSMRKNEIKGVPFFNGFCRYLAHLDNPEKAQYNPDDIISVNGLLPDFSKPAPYQSKNSCREEIISALKCRDNNINDIIDLFDFFSNNENVCEYIENHAYLCDKLLMSRGSRSQNVYKFGA